MSTSTDDTTPYDLDEALINRDPDYGSYTIVYDPRDVTVDDVDEDLADALEGEVKLSWTAYETVRRVLKVIVEHRVTREEFDIVPVGSGIFRRYRVYQGQKERSFERARDAVEYVADNANQSVVARDDYE